ncbi:MAG: formimidoylglutamate deiminase [Betaproteobacteria bacterium]|nr:formimidoylglutamate deiminase [Betaproteobacteria bacterium]
MKSLFAPAAMLPGGWAENVLIHIADTGDIVSVQEKSRPADSEVLDGPVIPGMANVHSHAFQRAMAGLAERMGSAEDSFWSWREVMYSFVRRLQPDQVRAIAEQIYCEMLKNGYTAVAEFHYLHNAPDGKPYANRAEMALCHLRAAAETGIAITLLPSLYAYANFGDEPLDAAQKRFATTPDAVLGMVRDLRKEFSGDANVRIGVAPHSLRAVSPAMLKDLLAGMAALDPGAPVHMHLAEQVKEVNDCLTWAEQRPVQWLLDNAPVDERWCLIHCTHAMSGEIEKLAASGAVVGLCPTTEANLGAGPFQFARYRERKGRFGIGSDSHVSQLPVEELRWVEYVQRLTLRRRNISANADQPSVGGSLWRAAAEGGAQAIGRVTGAIERGKRADFLVLDADHVNLVGRREDALLDALLFAGNGQMVRHVMVGGKWAVRDGHHPREEAIAARYKQVCRELTA